MDPDTPLSPLAQAQSASSEATPQTLHLVFPDDGEDKATIRVTSKLSIPLKNLGNCGQDFNDQDQLRGSEGKWMGSQQKWREEGSGCRRGGLYGIGIGSWTRWPLVWPATSV